MEYQIDKYSHKLSVNNKILRGKILSKGGKKTF